MNFSECVCDLLHLFHCFSIFSISVHFPDQNPESEQMVMKLSLIFKAKDGWQSHIIPPSSLLSVETCVDKAGGSAKVERRKLFLIIIIILFTN